VESATSSSRSVRLLSFHAPVAVINRLLRSITVRIVPTVILDDVIDPSAPDGIRRSHSLPSSHPASKVQDRTLAPGERLSWHHEHWDQSLHLQIKLDGFDWSEWTPLDKSTLGRHWVRCVDESGNDFRLGVDLIRAACGSLRASVFVPIWVHNRCLMPVLFAHHTRSEQRWRDGNQRLVAGQSHTEERISRYRRKLQRSQVGMLALVPKLTSLGSSSAHAETVMLDFTNCDAAQASIRMQAPDTLWSAPIELTSLTSADVVVELEEDLSRTRTVANDHPSDTVAVSKRHSIDTAAVHKKRPGLMAEQRRVFVFGLRVDRRLVGGSSSSHNHSKPKGLRAAFVTVAPRFVVINATPRSIHIAQDARTSDGVVTLRSGEKSPWHWVDGKGPRMIRVRFAEAAWTWGGALPPGDIGETVVRINNGVSHSVALLRVEIRQSEELPTLLCIIRSQNGGSDDLRHVHIPPPYRIHNFTVLPLRLHQAQVDASMEVCLKVFGFRLIVPPVLSLQTLLAYHSVEYAWNEPMKKKLLAVDAIVSGVAVRVGVFALDKLGSTVIPPTKQLNGKVTELLVAFHIPRRAYSVCCRVVPSRFVCAFARKVPRVFVRYQTRIVVKSPPSRGWTHRHPPCGRPG
jgi:SHR-binding domain of vacuolar-sorting associated protein 13